MSINLTLRVLSGYNNSLQKFSVGQHICIGPILGHLINFVVLVPMSNQKTYIMTILTPFKDNQYRSRKMELQLFIYLFLIF